MMLPSLVLLVLSAPHAPPVRPAGAEQVKLSDADLRDRVHAMLSPIEGGPTDAQWLALGAPAVPVLEEALADKHHLAFYRARALGALALLAPDAAKPRALSLAQDASQPYQLRDVALLTSGRLAKSDELATTLKPVLESSTDIRLRVRAAKVLAEANPTASCSAVKAQVARETEDKRILFRDAAARCSSVE